MDEKLREAIGRALYEASVPLMDDDEPAWNELPDEAKEQWIARAEKVVYVHNEWMREYLQQQLGIKKVESANE